MSKKVLTVDDSKTLRMIVGRNLKPFGVEIVEAENGSVGLAKAQSEKPDLILLDYNMPVMDGYQTLEALKQDPATRNIPVIMLTTETVKETVVKLIKLGLKDYIAKPFSREALLQKVNPVLALYEGDVVPEAEAKPEGGGQNAPSAGPGKKTVLVVDDKENVLKLLTEFLGDGLRVLTAGNGQAALSMIPGTNCDLLLLDMDMPDVSGLEVYRQSKASLESRHAKVVGMVLRTAQTDINNARQAGIKDFLYKPFTRADVTALCAGLGDGFDPGAEGARKTFLVPRDGVRILEFPQENDPFFKDFANALGTEIRRELSDMADEGINRLVIRLTSGVVADFAIVKKFLALLELVETLTLSVKLVTDEAATREKLKKFSETAQLQTFDSIDSAITTFA